MRQMREVKTCDRCRHFKRRCDLLKPSCSRCVQAGVRCSFDVGSAQQQQQPAADAVSSAPFIAANLARGESQQPRESPGREAEAVGLISPTTSTESPEPGKGAMADEAAPGAPGPAAAASQRIVRKRKRNCLSCLRCHRLKVKCDKELPCGRCKASGNGRECYYSYNKGPNGSKFPCPTAPVPSGREDKKPQMATWQVQHRVRGSSHWRELMSKIGALTGDSSPLASALEGVGTNACLANFCLPGNFPFGTPGANKYYARDAVTRLLAGERARAGDYLDRYTELLDVVNPVLDLPAFRAEVERYWQDPNGVSLCWLAQLLMALGLGCFTAADEPPAATELMMAAEACLMQTPFMFRPTLMTLRALALMAVAKLVCNATCWSVDSCWSLLGLLVRVAFIFGLPQERGEGDEELRDAGERAARRRLWLTIVYLDANVSLCTGMPPLTRADELAGAEGALHGDGGGGGGGGAGPGIGHAHGPAHGPAAGARQPPRRAPAVAAAGAHGARADQRGAARAHGLRRRAAAPRAPARAHGAGAAGVRRRPAAHHRRHLPAALPHGAAPAVRTARRRPRALPRVVLVVARVLAGAAGALPQAVVHRGAAAPRPRRPRLCPRLLLGHADDVRAHAARGRAPERRRRLGLPHSAAPADPRHAALVRRHLERRAGEERVLADGLPAAARRAGPAAGAGAANVSV